MRTRLLELLCIALLAVFANRYYLDFSNDIKLHGNEGEWLTVSALWSSQSLHEDGALPLWQPYLSRGEPTIDSPFAFILNPVSSLPSIIFGYPKGIQLTIVLTFILSGWGGWVIGSELGLSAFGRLLLGMMLVVRGPAHASIGYGYFQLGITQLYLPWIVAATIALIRRPRARWPIVLLALTLTLIFWGGNIYFTLPAIFIVGILVLFHMVDFRAIQVEGFRGKLWFPTFDGMLLRRSILALILGGLLASATLIPIFAHQNRIGRHPDEHGAGTYVDPLIVVQQLFEPLHLRARTGTWNENYYVYSMPIWLAAVVFLFLPLVEQLLPAPMRPNWKRRGRFWAAGIICMLWFLGWGTATNPFVAWMYEHLPLIAQWRYVGRMLTVFSLWVVVFAVIKIDVFVLAFNPLPELAKFRQRSLLAFNQEAAKQDGKRPSVPTASTAPHIGEVIGSIFGRGAVSGLLIGASLFAVLEVSESRDRFGGLQEANTRMDACVFWLRQQYPDDFLRVHTRDYFSVTAFIRNHIRLNNINADFDPEGNPTSIYRHDLSEAMPPFMIMYDYEEHVFWSEKGFRPLDGSPPLFNPDLPCVYYNPNTLDYAFVVALPTLEELNVGNGAEDRRFPLDPALTLPIKPVDFKPGHVRMTVESSDRESFVVVVQEVAWPGWTATVDGQPALVESVGQLIGVVLPPDGRPHEIEFVFTAPLLMLGSAISLGAFLFAGLFLLRVDDRLLGRTTAAQPPVVVAASNVNAPSSVTPTVTPEVVGTTIAPADAEDWGD